jgi:hypothetical protein
MKNGDDCVTAPVFATTRDEDEMSAFGDDDEHDVPLSFSDTEDVPLSFSDTEEGPLEDDAPMHIQDRKSDREAVAGRHQKGVMIGGVGRPVG